MTETPSPVFDFSARVALVTGATSGIGASVALGFARAGADVVASGRDEQRGASVKEAMEEAGARAEFVAGDITDSAFCDRLLDHAIGCFDGVDILVNCAGVIHHATAEQTTDAQWRETLAVNLDGVFFMCRAAIPALRRRGGGVIINIASDAGLSGSAHLVAYCASKGAVVQLTRALSIDHAGEGIRVVAVCPGDVDTPMLRGEYAQRKLEVTAGLAQSAAAVPLGRVCTPREVTDLVLYVACDSARFMTGSAVALDGGALA